MHTRKAACVKSFTSISETPSRLQSGEGTGGKRPDAVVITGIYSKPTRLRRAAQGTTTHSFGRNPAQKIHLTCRLHRWRTGCTSPSEQLTSDRKKGEAGGHSVRVSVASQVNEIHKDEYTHQQDVPSVLKQRGWQQHSRPCGGSAKAMAYYAQPLHTKPIHTRSVGQGARGGEEGKTY